MNGTSIVFVCAALGIRRSTSFIGEIHGALSQVKFFTVKLEWSEIIQKSPLSAAN